MTKSKDTRKNTYYGVGYYGELATTRIKDIPGYSTWLAMMQRCYDPKQQDRFPRYKRCTVADEWHCLSNFSRWYEDNHYEIEGERVELDKDILVKGNKVYSPDTCLFVPKKINALFITGDARRGGLPIGVSCNAEDFSYVAAMSANRKICRLGAFDTPAEAFLEYKFFKEFYIRQVAEEYKDKIPKKLYDALMDWQVEITD